MKHIFLLLFVLTSCTQGTKDDGSCKLIETFFATYETNGVEKALDGVFNTNAYFSTVSNGNINKIKKELSSYTDSIGKYCGYEIVGKRIVGESIVHYTCLVKYETHPLRFSFIFYKPENIWMLYDFQYDMETMSELKESAKFYYIE